MARPYSPLSGWLMRVRPTSNPRLPTRSTMSTTMSQRLTGSMRPIATTAPRLCSHGITGKLPGTGGYRTTEIHSVTFLDLAGYKRRIRQPEVAPPSFRSAVCHPLAQPAVTRKHSTDAVKPPHLDFRPRQIRPREVNILQAGTSEIHFVRSAEQNVEALPGVQLPKPSVGHTRVHQRALRGHEAQYGQIGARRNPEVEIAPSQRRSEVSVQRLDVYRTDGRESHPIFLAQGLERPGGHDISPADGNEVRVHHEHTRAHHTSSSKTGAATRRHSSLQPVHQR